jgi:hypothetical protein
VERYDRNYNMEDLNRYTEKYFGFAAEEKWKKMDYRNRYRPVVKEFMNTKEFKNIKSFGEERWKNDMLLRKIIQEYQNLRNDVMGGRNRYGSH